MSDDWGETFVTAGNDADEIPVDLVSRLQNVEEELDRMEKVMQMATHIMVPILLAAVLIITVIILHPNDFPAILSLMALFGFTPAGKFTASFYAARDVPIWEPMLVLGTIDLIVGLFLVWNLPAIYRIPALGPRLARLEKAGERLVQRDWIRRAAFLGLVILVAIPFQGTGAVAGAFAGRLLGMGANRTIAAIAIGGYGGVAALTLAGRGIQLAGQANTGLGFAVAGLLIAAVLFGALRWWKPSHD